MTNNVTIYCCYHTPKQKLQYKNSNLVWIYGPNDHLNKFFSEFSMFKWIYENDKYSKYIGCCHYKRQFQLHDIDYNYLDDEHCIVLNRRIIPSMNTDRYGSIRKWSRPDWQDCEFIYFDFIDYIRSKEEYIKYYHADEFCAENSLFYSRSSFIMNRRHFFNLWEYIGGFFDYLDYKYELNHDFNTYDKFMKYYALNYGKETTQGWFNEYTTHRLFAYLGELLVSNYITANFALLNVKYLNDNVL